MAGPRETSQLRKDRADGHGHRRSPQRRPPPRQERAFTRRLCTITGFYKYAVEEELLEHSPAAHVRRPRLDYGSHVGPPCELRGHGYESAPVAGTAATAGRGERSSRSSTRYITAVAANPTG